jgi:CubicO group peptidase (beta-lactamase class C family)
MELVERGKIDLDKPIQTYVPSFPEKPWPITLRQLLGHFGGVRHYRGEELESTRRYNRLSDGLAIFRDDPLVCEPGTKHVYSTYGYNLLGAAVEGASGLPFVDFVTENVFRTARMDHARADDSDAIIPRRAHGYVKSPDGRLRNSRPADLSYKIPGGGLCATVGDLAKFAIAVQTGKLVKRESRDAMFTRQVSRDGQVVEYGLGWRLQKHAGREEVSHTGGQQQVSTLLYMIPDRRFAVVLMANLEHAELASLARAIADVVVP